MARGRRSDHTRDELRDLVIGEGSRLMEEVGYAGFSARELARRIGYSVSTVLNVAGGNEQLAMAINTRTFSMWADALEGCLRGGPQDRIAALVNAYFDFAEGHRRLWMAIFDHKPDIEIPEEQAIVRGRLTGIVVDEVTRMLPEACRSQGSGLARSLIATVHGHCTYALSGSFSLMGEDNPRGAALARVRDSIAMAQANI